MTNIPSQEAIARAKRRMRERDKNMTIVNVAVGEYFNVICPDKAHSIFVIAEDFFVFRAYVFYKSDQDVLDCEREGISSMLKSFVEDELERQGRGGRKDVNISYEFDSDENVQAKYEGDYYLRMR